MTRKNNALAAFVEESNAPRARKRKAPAPAPVTRPDDDQWLAVVEAWQAAKEARKRAEVSEKALSEALKSELLARLAACLAGQGEALPIDRVIPEGHAARDFLGEVAVVTTAGTVALRLQDCDGYEVAPRTDRILTFKGSK